ncbi:ADP-ribosylglycohydrolase family protein [Nesterenkonia xinjiangensis]|uniref:Uncharacterized protein n=1 Tax=Nesterenkonia xinjiangensis TaxID=225327 RepID=A0A7Z0GK75_9MICC|nr:ADP-ribosylglycohydrolase family protein [Nesterenkonia xinjiangensis]NYJ76636.1 hypothetical protein [Nesterenkonia xinjiangensis]
MTPDDPSLRPPAPDGFSDARLITRFAPVLRAGLGAALAAGDSGPRLHAEALHQVCLADGLLELLDWTRQGVAADPLACLWLASLRWHRLLTGSFPEGAPEPPARATDRALAELLNGRSPTLALMPDSGEVSRRGLATGEMAYPSSPAQPECADPSGLLRLVPLALVPYVEDSMLLRWTEQALALTQGHPRLHADAARLVATVRGLGAQEEPGPAAVRAALAQARDIMTDADEVTAAAVLAQVRAAGGQQPDVTALPDELEATLQAALLTPWQRVTAPV